MPTQWSADDDRALLLSLVQVMAPNGPSKHQFEGARAILDNRWTLSAITYDTSTAQCSHCAITDILAQPALQQEAQDAVARHRESQCRSSHSCPQRHQAQGPYAQDC